MSSFFRGLVFLLVFGLVAACYWTGLDSPIVFDDDNIIGNGSVFDHAINSDVISVRAFPYFTVGLLHVLSGGDLVWNRVCNLVLHGLIGIALYFFVLRATASSAKAPQTNRSMGMLVVLWFLLNPVAVYGTGYLIQRTIVMATLFGLVSATLYLRAQQEQRNADILSATLLGALAMLSKEHAVMLPVAIVTLTPLVACWSRTVVLRAAGFIVLSIPCMFWAIQSRAVDVVGKTYEIYSGQVLAQMTLSEFSQTTFGLWLLSGATQLLLFWKYLILWLIPNPEWMSVDMRVDFPVLWAGWGAWLGLLFSILAFGGASWVWWRHGRASLLSRLAAPVLYLAVLFSVELSVVRIQEPFVLYRSFLWMPGYALIVAFLFQAAERAALVRGIRWTHGLWVLGTLGCLTLYPLAQDRLRSFSSQEALWKDAEAKLRRPDVAGADRIYYNLAGEAFKRKDYATALLYSDKVIRQNPEAFQGYLARGSVLLAQRDVNGALREFDAADAHQPPKEFRGYIEFKRCGAYSVLGDKDGTIACLRRSAQQGYEVAKLHLRMAGIAE